jgi:hypothetical protein
MLEIGAQVKVLQAAERTVRGMDKGITSFFNAVYENIFV